MTISNLNAVGITSYANAVKPSFTYLPFYRQDGENLSTFNLNAYTTQNLYAQESTALFGQSNTDQFFQNVRQTAEAFAANFQDTSRPNPLRALQASAISPVEEITNDSKTRSFIELEYDRLNKQSLQFGPQRQQESIFFGLEGSQKVSAQQSIDMLTQGLKIKYEPTKPSLETPTSQQNRNQGVFLGDTSAELASQAYRNALATANAPQVSADALLRQGLALPTAGTIPPSQQTNEASRYGQRFELNTNVNGDSQNGGNGNLELLFGNQMFQDGEQDPNGQQQPQRQPQGVFEANYKPFVAIG